MSRIQRRKSSTGVYHVMLRGVNKQMVFLKDADNLKFLEVLQKVKEISVFELLGFCLMGNHVHLLIQEKETGEPLDKIMQRIQNRFISWYNYAYDRCGPLFCGRFRSEAVEDEAYLYTVLRYIHQNPVKAGICAHMSAYRWSSFADYADGRGLVEGLVNTENVIGNFGQAELMRYFEEETYDFCLDDFSDSELEDAYEKYFRMISEDATPETFDEKGKAERKRIVESCLKVGMPKKKITELTGLSYARMKNLQNGV